MACQSSSTSGALHLLFLTCVVSMEERTNSPSCAHKQSSSDPFRKNSYREVCCNHCRIVVNCCKLPEPVHYSEATFLRRTWYDHLDWAVAIFLLVCQKLDAHGPYRHTFLAVLRALETLEHIGRFLSSFMTKTPFGTLQQYLPPQTAHHCTASSRAQKRTTKCSFRAGKQ